MIHISDGNGKTAKQTFSIQIILMIQRKFSAFPYQRGNRDGLSCVTPFELLDPLVDIGRNVLFSSRVRLCNIIVIDSHVGWNSNRRLLLILCRPRKPNFCFPFVAVFRIYVYILKGQHICTFVYTVIPFSYIGIYIFHIHAYILYVYLSSAILVRTSAIPQYCGQPKRLRNCGLKKVAVLRLLTFNIWLPQFRNSPQSPAGSKTFLSLFLSSGCFWKSTKNNFRIVCFYVN